jgi:NO-binding membrane sensor protein with MHYT domain
MPVSHEPWLVALSLVVAIQGAYVGLSLAVKVGAAEGLRRRVLLAGAAISLAVAIWAMHFVGMLAARLPFPVDYLVFPTLLSFLVCVIVLGAGVFAASAGPPSLMSLAAASVFMGGGITTMHYIGMTALHASAHMEHAPDLVVASVAVAIAASGLALWLSGGRGGRPPLLIAAAAFGIAITGMHYTAMAGLTVYPHGSAPSGAPALSPDLLAIVVAVVAFLVSGIFLLTLVPERVAAAAGTIATPVTIARPAALAAPEVPAAPAAELGHGTFAPLGGAGGPPRRLARHLPIERDGATQFLSVERVIAVHANSHYTYVFDGRTKLFCPLAIGDVESRLDAGRFARVHRSHIVAIDRIVGLKRAGDNGLIELAAEQDRYTVPVSRSRFGWLKSRLGERAGEALS